MATDRPMQLGMIGLGRMGASYRRLVDAYAAAEKAPEAGP